MIDDLRLSIEKAISIPDARCGTAILAVFSRAGSPSYVSRIQNRESGMAISQIENRQSKIENK
jgi:hypothetical protein